MIKCKKACFLKDFLRYTAIIFKSLEKEAIFRKQRTWKAFNFRIYLWDFSIPAYLYSSHLLCPSTGSHYFDLVYYVFYWLFWRGLAPPSEFRELRNPITLFLNFFFRYLPTDKSHRGSWVPGFWNIESRATCPPIAICWTLIKCQQIWPGAPNGGRDRDWDIRGSSQMNWNRNWNWNQETSTGTTVEINHKKEANQKQ